MLTLQLSGGVRETDNEPAAKAQFTNSPPTPTMPNKQQTGTPTGPLPLHTLVQVGTLIMSAARPLSVVVRIDGELHGSLVSTQTILTYFTYLSSRPSRSH